MKIESILLKFQSFIFINHTFIEKTDRISFFMEFDLLRSIYKLIAIKNPSITERVFFFYLVIVCFLSGPTETIFIGTSTSFSMNSM